VIRARALAVAVGAASVREIDRLNIRRASILAMRRALARLAVQPAHVLVDGLPAPELGCPHEAIVDGDVHCHSIAAASVVAKTVRDYLMELLGRRHPIYGWASNKGCGRAGQSRPLWVAVQLEQGPGARAGAAQRVEVEGIRLALADQAAGGVADGVDPAVLRRAHQPARQLLFRLVRAVVDCGDDVVRLG